MADERRSDAELARREACSLLDLGDDPERLCASDRLRVDLVCSLRAAVDNASAGLLGDGSTSADLSRLISATESLIKLLPARKLESPEPTRSDPREALLQMIMQMRERGADVFEGYRGKVKQVEALQAEVAALKAEIASWDGSRPSADSTPTLAEPSPQPASEKPRSQPAGGKVVDLRASRANGAGGSAGFRVGPADEPWRRY